jgi:imidazolonepropionase-like amidohydrolase
VREQLRRGARLIKVCASGGVLSELDSPIHQQFTGSELRTIVEVAGLADRVVAAHCHGKPGIMAAIEAGVATIEHGTFLDEEACDAMIESGTILVPTRSIVEDILKHLADVPPYAAEKLTAIAQTHADAVRLAIERGVTVAMGTDICITGMDLPNSWGNNGTELAHLVTLGMTPVQAIAAATAVAPRTLGPQAPRSGQLAAGFDGDFITLDADPVTDISVLSKPEHIFGVWRAGRRVKG